MAKTEVHDNVILKELINHTFESQETISHKTKQAIASIDFFCYF